MEENPVATEFTTRLHRALFRATPDMSLARKSTVSGYPTGH